uniref:Interferon 1AF2 n=2 Tax=Otolemur garnettii TaxID=30611 RepID=A0A7R8C3H3_OTOGA|nr:TPA: interferon 1AF2 [Otolemur garnettii]
MGTFRKWTLVCSLFKTEAQSKVSREPRDQDSGSPTSASPAATSAFTMASLFSVPVVLMVLSCMSICSLGCHLPKSPILNTAVTLKILAQMRRIHPFLCLKDRRYLGFPQEEFKNKQPEKNQAITVLYVVVQHIFSLFSTTESSDAWNKTLLDQLRTNLGWQLQELESCLMSLGEEEGTPLMNQGPTLAVRSYFQRLILYLQEKKYSLCAWEIVRTEIMRSYSYSKHLQNTLMKNGVEFNT